MTHKLLSEKINEMLRPLFCPRTADEEKHLSDLITSVHFSIRDQLLNLDPREYGCYESYKMLYSKQTKRENGPT